MSNEKVLEQALSRADEIGARAWAELIHWKIVDGTVQSVFSLLVIGISAVGFWLLRRYWDDWEGEAVFLTAIVAVVLFVIGLYSLCCGLISVLAPGGAAINSVLQ